MSCSSPCTFSKVLTKSLAGADPYPERMAKRIPALAPPTEATWPETLPRPTRLLDPPELVVSTALLPARIAPEWWAGDPDGPSRDGAGTPEARLG